MNITYKGQNWTLIKTARKRYVFKGDDGTVLITTLESLKPKEKRTYRK